MPSSKPPTPSRASSIDERWSERAHLGELNSVLYARGSERANLMMHGASLFGARVALALSRKTCGPRTLLDFGCGTGRLLRFFAPRGWTVLGTDITLEMLSEARRLGLPNGATTCVSNGVSVPLRDESVDLVWICGVLKYSLFPPSATCRGGLQPSLEAAAAGAFQPTYRDIAREMHRVLKPGGMVVNVEMWVDAPPEAFTPDFECVGFTTKRVRLLRRYEGRAERLCQWRDWHSLPPKYVTAAAQLIAAARYWLDDPRRPSAGLRDYIFVWSKPRINAVA